jgi:hypothetical protein
MNAESEMAGADGLGGPKRLDPCTQIAESVGYSATDDETGSIETLIDYKNSLEDAVRRLTDDDKAALPGIDTEPLEGYEIMREVLAVILNREETTAEQINAFLRGEVGAEGLYEAHIAPAITTCERAIREEI